jgi:hypothetical protein
MRQKQRFCPPCGPITAAAGAPFATCFGAHSEAVTFANSAACAFSSQRKLSEAGFSARLPRQHFINYQFLSMFISKLQNVKLCL